MNGKTIITDAAQIRRIALQVLRDLKIPVGVTHAQIAEFGKAMRKDFQTMENDAALIRKRVEYLQNTGQGGSWPLAMTQ